MTLQEAVSVPGYEGLYSVTRDGRLYSHRSDKFLSNKPHSSGYVYWRLSSKHYKAHRVVAMTFLGGIDGKVINHINVNRADNRVENLEIVTHKQNSEHANSLGLYPRGEAHAE